MATKNHLPERTCLGCGAKDRTTAMVRLSAIDEERLELNKQTGRGGYLHREENCWRMFIHRKNHSRAFHIEISRTAREQLVHRLKSRNGE